MKHQVKIHCNIKECKAECCHNIPMDKGYISAYRKRIVTPIIRFEDVGGGNVIPVTDDDWKKNKCPFLTDKYRCNIYEVRPIACRKFAVDTEESKWLRCKFLGQVYDETDEVAKDSDADKG